MIERPRPTGSFQVDLWYQGNGVAPLVQPLDDWPLRAMNPLSKADARARPIRSTAAPGGAR